MDAALEEQLLGQGLSQLRKLKIALVHYWLLRMRGGEKVIEALSELYPQADIYTLFYSPQDVSTTIRSHTVVASCLQALLGAYHYYRSLLPLFPLAIEQFDLSDYDLVISSESGVAKGVVLPASACHICYCHTPMRYLWDMYHFYRKYRQRAVSKLVFALAAHYLRMWDYASAARVSHFIANSTAVSRRIATHYGRESVVIPPPVSVEKFFVSESIEDYYLIVSELVQYKRVDLAVKAFSRLDSPLLIVGNGPERRHLQKLATANVKFVGFVPEERLAHLYSTARAVLMPGVEDAGIVPVEAQASGRPVIAFRAGGALDTIMEGETGLFFDELQPESLSAAIQRFETTSKYYCPKIIRQHAEHYSRELFQQRMVDFVSSKWRMHPKPASKPNASTENQWTFVPDTL